MGNYDDHMILYFKYLTVDFVIDGLSINSFISMNSRQINVFFSCRKLFY